MSLGNTEVGAIFLGGIQIYPTGSSNYYSYSLTNVQTFYSNGSGKLEADASNTVFFTATYVIKRGSTTVFTKENVELNIQTVPNYCLKNAMGRLVWNKTKYGKSVVYGGTINVLLNYGHITTTGSFVLEANNKIFNSGTCELIINGTSGYTVLPATAGGYAVNIAATVEYGWTSGMLGGTETIEDIANFNFWLENNYDSGSFNEWVYLNNGNLIIEANTTGKTRVAVLHAVLIGNGTINSQIEIVQNYR